MPRSLLLVSALPLLLLVACGNSSSSTTTTTTGTGGAGTGGAGTGGFMGPITDCAMISTNQCFSNDDCSSASDRCESEGTTDNPVACCVKGARGTGMAGTPCTKLDDCAVTCDDDGSGNDTYLCSKACTSDADCPASLPTCVTLNTGIGMGSFCGPSE
jgi:hypothetical protein